MRNKTTAALVAFFLGGLGGHKFYLGQTFMGLLYLCFCWTFVPAIISLFEGIGLLLMSEASFDAKYNAGLLPAVLQAQPQQIVVNVQNTASAGHGDLTSRLKDLHALKVSGVLTEEEFQSQKAKLLAAG
jgi:TM2 domain-containing membrane protein YozV